MQGIGLLFYFFVLIMSVVIHEVSHGYAAYFLGDPTAKYADRLTLNPVRHMDLMGSFIVPFLTYHFGGLILGWAKPVPYNPYNLKNQKWGPAIVGLAGPLSNFVVAAVFGLFFRFGFLFRFIPQSFFEMAYIIAVVNISLAVFNLVPVPPLDGSKLLYAFLPHHFRRQGVMILEQYGLIFLFIFIVFFAQVIFPIIGFLIKILTGA